MALGPGPGRGAWLCRATFGACFDQAGRRKAFLRALAVSPSAETLEVLKCEFERQRSPGLHEGPVERDTIEGRPAGPFRAT